jgi:hypothetical protein
VSSIDENTARKVIYALRVGLPVFSLLKLSTKTRLILSCTFSFALSQFQSSPIVSLHSGYNDFNRVVSHVLFAPSARDLSYASSISSFT